MNGTPREEREAAEAKWLHEDRETLHEDRELLREDAENAEEVDFEVARPLAVTTSFRLSPGEAETIRQAARVRPEPVRVDPRRLHRRRESRAGAGHRNPRAGGAEAAGVARTGRADRGAGDPGELSASPGAGSLLGVR